MESLNRYMIDKDRERIYNFIERKGLSMEESSLGIWYYIDNEGGKKNASRLFYLHYKLVLYAYGAFPADVLHVKAGMDNIDDPGLFCVGPLMRSGIFIIGICGDLRVVDALVLVLNISMDGDLDIIVG